MPQNEAMFPDRDKPFGHRYLNAMPTRPYESSWLPLDRAGERIACDDRWGDSVREHQGVLVVQVLPAMFAGGGAGDGRDVFAIQPRA